MAWPPDPPPPTDHEPTPQERLESFAENFRRLLHAHEITITMIEGQEATVWYAGGDRLKRLGVLPMRPSDDGASARQIGAEFTGPDNYGEQSAVGR